MNSPSLVNCSRLRDAFEGREAIYVEKGVLRVRVTNIRYDINTRQMNADIEEIPTPGLERSLLHERRPDKTVPLRWGIGAGYLTTYSEDTWAMGYGGWTLYFGAEVVGGLASLAAEWPAELAAWERYEQALRFVETQPHTQSERVFPD